MKTREERLEYDRNRMRRRRTDPTFVRKEKEYYKKWYATHGRNRAIDYREAIIDWQNNNPEKFAAHRKVSQAVATGKLVKPKDCTICRRQTRLVGHHPDYSKPLEVLWLCSSCHKLEHTPPEKRLPIDT